jgi:DnaJ-class molecular chaperone
MYQTEYIINPNMRDYHRILRVGRDSSMIDIKRSYRRLARKHHPDKGGDPSVFRQLNEAYRQLARTDHNDQQTDVLLDADADLSHFLQDTLFGTSPSDFDTNDPPIHLYPVSVTLSDVCHGTNIEVMVTRTVVNHRLLRPCQQCNGTGVAIITQRLPGSHLGFGIEPSVSCVACINGFMDNSIHMTTEHDKVSFRLPSGCPSGMMFRFPGKGDHLPGLPCSDLVVVIRYQEDCVFSVPINTLDLHCNLLITLYESLVGFNRTVVYPDQTSHLLTRDSVTKPGTYVIVGDGLHFISEGRKGDLCVDIHVEYPVSVDVTGDTLRSILCYDQAPPDMSLPYVSSPLKSLDSSTLTRVDDLLRKNMISIYGDLDPVKGVAPG